MTPKKSKKKKPVVDAEKLPFVLAEIEETIERLRLVDRSELINGILVAIEDAEDLTGQLSAESAAAQRAQLKALRETVIFIFKKGPAT